MTLPLRAIDLDTVQAFVWVADLGSFTRAAETLDTSQAAISLKLKRLEDRLGCRLLERTPRHVRLSPEGESFLAPARDLLAAHARALSGIAPAPPRRLVLGISDHVAGPELPGLVARLAATDPGLVIEVRIGPSRDLGAAFDRGEVDAVIVRREGERRDGRLLAEERVGWFAASTWRRRPGEPLRLATLAAPCGVRAVATRALDAAGIPWTEVFVGGGVLALGAAISAGLGVAALAGRVTPAGAVEVGESLGLPPLPASQVVLRTRLADARAREALRVVGSAFRSAIPR
ncbi:LysR family transcriptional regulator [Methylobacterium soli]|uniref:LysR family transcriptional regulator n=2 Tax=Methylobacterium soli TaxID=553447 RepID=A0A6L3T202_9HYPH|nr:LysR family transcriptional regulator [Methylobacterium soli]KAB1079878.1 LysR family transcriptional regulator [Methylobacterium soli]